MTTPQTDNARNTRIWLVPSVALVLGIGYFIVGWNSGDLGFGLFGLGLMATIAVALLLLRRRSETIQGLLDNRDERINSLDLKATAFTAMVLILALIAGFMIEVAQGNDGAPHSWLGALGGVTYVGALAVLRWRG